VTDAESCAHWYALHVRPNYEMAVASRLRGLGIEEYVPLRKTSAVSGRNKPSPRSPLFPGYVFSFMDLQLGPRLYKIPGVLRVLGSGGQPTPLENEEIAMVRSVANSSLPAEPVPYLQAGDKVRLSSGPLAGISGTFVRMLDETRLVVSLPLLQRSLALTMPAEWVTADAAWALAG
jgi:transcription termination/antitermination protein NusG